MKDIEKLTKDELELVLEYIIALLLQEIAPD